MENKSILDQIINNQKAEEVARLDAVEIITNLFSELTDREKDVLIRRFGLHGKEKETLENIGNVHQLTRERIRQIETSGIKKLRQLKNLDSYISNLKKVIIQLLEEHGGLMERGYLLDLLMTFSADSARSKRDEALIHKSYLDFLISKLLHTEFEEVNTHKYFKSLFKLKYQTLDHLEDIIKELTAKIEDNNKIYSTSEMIEIFNGLDSIENHKEKLSVENNVDISKILNTPLYKEDPNLINNNKVLYTLLRAAKKIEQNKFGHWGMHNFREIKPKTINDKIYLVLKYYNRPMHFAEIADEINKIGFDNKKANAATVHNELILDDKYILVGRGLYALKEWGNKKGTVADVIVDVLNESGSALSRDEIIERVLNKRIVKKATIILALMNKDRFIKDDSNRYWLAKENDSGTQFAEYTNDESEDNIDDVESTAEESDESAEEMDTIEDLAQLEKDNTDSIKEE